MKWRHAAIFFPKTNSRALSASTSIGLNADTLWHTGACGKSWHRIPGIAARELRFRTTQYGKPFLDPSCDLHFNLSHSGELAVVAVGANELGVDLEFIRPLEDFENVATSFFSIQRD